MSGISGEGQASSREKSPIDPEEQMDGSTQADIAAGQSSGPVSPSDHSNITPYLFPYRVSPFERKTARFTVGTDHRLNENYQGAVQLASGHARTEFPLRNLSFRIPTPQAIEAGSRYYSSIR